jgi:hypothetical protein
MLAMLPVEIGSALFDEDAAILADWELILAIPAVEIEKALFDDKAAASVVD